MPPAHGRRLAENLPRGRLIEIPDSYTLVPLDQPAALADAIERASSRWQSCSSPVAANSLRVEAVSDPVDGDANESGVLLPGPHARLGGPTFEHWLDAVSR